MRKIFTLIIVLLSVAAVYASELADSATCVKKPRQSVGLVLSGGGAKGIAHAGVIQALEENGIPMTTSPARRWVRLLEAFMRQGIRRKR